MKTTARKRNAPHPNRVPSDWIGLKKHASPPMPLRAMSGLKALARTDVPAGVELSSAPELPAANVALTPGQLEVRLQVYEYLAEQHIPLFEPDAPPVEHTGDGDEARAVCWGCGKLTPFSEDRPGTRTMACKAPGWVAIQTLTGAGGVRVETWCPECAAMPGYGCVEEPESRCRRPCR